MLLCQACTHWGVEFHVAYDQELLGIDTGFLCKPLNREDRDGHLSKISTDQVPLSKKGNSVQCRQ
jgi:hypothetical protein